MLSMLGDPPPGEALVGNEKTESHKSDHQFDDTHETPPSLAVNQFSLLTGLQAQDSFQRPTPFHLCTYT